MIELDKGLILLAPVKGGYNEGSIPGDAAFFFDYFIRLR